MTTHALVAVSETTYGGIYYTDNFTGSGAQPRWTRLTTTGLPSLEPDTMRVDYNDPLNVQYLGFDVDWTGSGSATIYARNGGNWYKAMDLTIAKAVAGVSASTSAISGLWTDPTAAAGVVYTTAWYQSGTFTYPHYVLKSTDYGVNWTLVSTVVRGISWGWFQAIGSYFWASSPNALYTIIVASDDGGANWDEDGYVGMGLWWPSLTVDNADGKYCYAVPPSGGEDLFQINAGTTTHADTAFTSAPTRRVDNMWTDIDNAGTACCLIADSIHRTTDRFTNDASVTLVGAGNDLSALTKVDAVGSTAFVFGINSSGAGAEIWYLSTNTDTSPEKRSGDNPGVAPYTDSIPTVGYVPMWGIWAGEAPADKGVFVYSVEEDAITDIPVAANLGTPMFGDRSSWRDLDADDDGLAVATPLADYHAQDIWADTPQRHNPWPAASGAAPVSDGTKYVATDIATQAELNAHAALPNVHHDAVTLDADAAVLLDLSTQEIGLDTQNANLVFAGPATAPANEPTFRALVLADLPAIDLDDLADVNTGGVDDGDALVYDTGTSTWIPGDNIPPAATLHGHVVNEDHSAECDGSKDAFPTSLNFISGTTAVYLNGVRQRFNTHYTEDVTLDGITMVTPPETGDELILDYIISYADWLTLIGGLQDSDSIALADSNNELLNDSL